MTEDVGLVFGLLAFVFFQLSRVSVTHSREIYERGPSCIPAGAFGIIWTIMYILIFFSGYYMFQADVQNYYTPILSLFIVNLFLNKFWSVAFFDMESPKIAVVIALFLTLTGAAVVVLMGIEGHWLSLGLYVPYVAWCAVAIVLNMMFIARQPGKEDTPLPTVQPKRRPLQAPRIPQRSLLKRI